MIRLLLFIGIWTIFSFGNDSSYYGSGNELIPIRETKISITKELLQIRRIDSEHLEVNVEYHFFNPGRTKRLLVGFEAKPPAGDVDGTPKNGCHPYLRDFSVQMNGRSLPYECSIVKTGDHLKSGKIDARSTSEVVITTEFDPNYPEFIYLYHFKADFEHGDNMIVHRYRYRLSNSVMERYSFDYILTGARRWAGGKIGEFFLSIDLGPDQHFAMLKSFFDSVSEWKVDGKVREMKKCPTHWLEENGKRCVEFFVSRGAILFHKKGFGIKGNLEIVSLDKPVWEEP